MQRRPDIERGSIRPRDRRPREVGPVGWILRIGLGVVVALVLLTDIVDNLRRTVVLLAGADWGRAFAGAEEPGDAAEPAALKAEIAALLSDDGLIRDATGLDGAEQAGFRFDGCELVLEVRFSEAMCEAPDIDASSQVRAVEWRHDLRNYVLHPFLQPEKVPVLTRDTGAGLKAVLSYPMVPAMVPSARLAYEGYLLRDPENLDAPDASSRLETVKSITEDIDAGELGLFIQQNRERTTFCDGSHAIRPVLLDRLVMTALPADGTRLRSRLHALSKRACPTRSWLFDLGR